MNTLRSVAVRLGITPFDVLAVSLFFGGLAAYSLTGITWLALILGFEGLFPFFGRNRRS